MLNQLKGIKSGLKEVNLRTIKESLQDIQSQLLNYDNQGDEVKEHNIYKLYKLMKNTDIFNLSFTELEIYINKLISIIEFIEL